MTYEELSENSEVLPQAESGQRRGEVLPLAKSAGSPEMPGRRTVMGYIKDLLKAIDANDMYPIIRTVQDLPYPELVIDGKEYLCFCSNNYLGLSTHPKVKQAALEAVQRYGIGTCESRLVIGNLQVYEDLEKMIADFKGEEAAVIFLSGYLTNLGAISGIMDSMDAWGLPSIDNRENLVVGDFLNHRSIQDALRLTKSPSKSYLHNDMDHLERILKRNREKRKLIVTDGVFSMEGDLAPLPQIVELAKIYEATVMVDDAHGTGVMGANGRGTAEHFGVERDVDVHMGTLSKALGALGGFIAGSTDLARHLKINSAPFIFTSSIPPETACGIMAAFEVMQNNPELRVNLWRSVSRLREGMSEMGIDVSNSDSHIIPVVIGEEHKCTTAARMLFEKGIIASTIKWPAVAEGQSRLRITAMATHGESQIERLLETLRDVLKKIGLL